MTRVVLSQPRELCLSSEHSSAISSVFSFFKFLIFGRLGAKQNALSSLGCRAGMRMTCIFLRGSLDIPSHLASRTKTWHINTALMDLHTLSPAPFRGPGNAINTSSVAIAVRTLRCVVDVQKSALNVLWALLSSRVGLSSCTAWTDSKIHRALRILRDLIRAFNNPCLGFRRHLRLLLARHLELYLPNLMSIFIQNFLPLPAASTSSAMLG